ncbi:zf-HC2 domain-containing protein [Nocardioides daphniae]|uniref:Zinc-finger domain-containing protein n=1 Tax=Nocardioides daphniae TaxID=402297 RepID=A0A4P7U9P3_9ACTN|nr:zf-HC2 domain-containing protein [Nocardioides daphniae]QCC76686.1 hypothetical protein E2C04_04665 [Nocardioides daphniae]GGD15311.1 hypothetical protein GCM10007231_12910 [Nocardioides daphniae]
MIGGHLGTKVSALLDGCLSPAEEERAWEHVHTCHPCRDAVEREGWVKTQLSQIGPCPSASRGFSVALRESLLSPHFAAAGATYPDELPEVPVSQSVRPRHLVALGSSAIGMAVLGVVALGAAPANAPSLDRRAPTTSIVPPTTTSVVRPATTPAATATVRPYVLRDTMAP